jgi:inhibitor of KinA
MRLEPLGDQAVMAYCVDENAAFALAEYCRRARFAWIVDVVQAYTSVAVFYDLNRVDFDRAAAELSALETTATGAAPGRLHVIPCCYDFGLDLERIAEHTGLGVEEVISQHTGIRYTVFAIGFCPGFPYLGYLPDALSGVPRLASPRLRVEAGSVGLTGRQTGIYTEERPGGWNIVGRTPLDLVNVADGYFPLRTGDHVEFRRIGVDEYQRNRGSRLERDDNHGQFLVLSTRRHLPRRG